MQYVETVYRDMYKDFLQRINMVVCDIEFLYTYIYIYVCRHTYIYAYGQRLLQEVVNKGLIMLVCDIWVK